MATDPSRGVMEYFKGKSVVLTGGNSGIGHSAARLLRKAGAHLVLVARNEDRLAATRDELTPLDSSGAELYTLSLDISDRGAVETALAELPLSRPVDILISNAGITRPGHFLELPAEEFDLQMVERQSGQLCYVSSILGLMGIFGYAAYAPSKFALRGFAEAMRCELKPKGIKVSICYPPDTDTPQHWGEEPFLPAETKAIAGNTKLMSPEEVASALLGGMAKGCFHIVPGGSTKFADVMYRLFPGFVRYLFDSDVRKATRG